MYKAFVEYGMILWNVHGLNGIQSFCGMYVGWMEYKVFVECTWVEWNTKFLWNAHGLNGIQRFCGMYMEFFFFSNFQALLGCSSDLWIVHLFSGSTVHNINIFWIPGYFLWFMTLISGFILWYVIADHFNIYCLIFSCIYWIKYYGCIVYNRCILQCVYGIILWMYCV